MRAFIIAVLLFLAVAAAVYFTSGPAIGQPADAAQVAQEAQRCLDDLRCIVEEGRRAKAAYVAAGGSW